MAGPQLMPVASHWLLLLLLLLLSGELVPANNTEGFYEDFTATMPALIALDLMPLSHLPLRGWAKATSEASEGGLRPVEAWAAGRQSSILIPAMVSTGSPCSLIRQNPRFVARKRGSKVMIRCQVKTEDQVEWLWKQEGDQAPKLLTLDPPRIYQNKTQSIITLIIQGIQYQDNGIYFCRQKCPDKTSHVGCGTELRVMGFSTVAELQQRNMLKDGIIMIQTLLIIVFIVVPIFLLLDKDDGKPGMEEDHTYEGLNIDQTATYEDIVTLRTGEVKWSVGEHPGQE
ncbi:B-cell antigen receptor complex-associated protein beta chain [Suncus etruscus]|uniref:B-cell antigen receptor complex-associated protein beta chain n=1 Tax=Suncus etruscus TaxID=109475 RepID=UPI0021107E6C|nr:B-cell antigen receptor complex-associated protein beta chain [Suncus etruscus]